MVAIRYSCSQKRKRIKILMKFLKLTLILLVIAIIYLSLTPKYTLTIGNDKISHFIAYSVLMFNIGLLTFNAKKKFITGALIAICFGIMIEVIQHFVPGRFMSVYDILANTAGVFIGITLTILGFKPTHKLLNYIGLK